MSGSYGLKLGSGGMGCDFSAGPIDFDRMRRERLEKAKKTLKKHGIAAALLFRPENIRYTTSVKYADFIDRLRYSLVPAEGDPILFEAFGRTVSEAPWQPPERVRLSLH
jgi:Xaa-Pro aminopeptidase